MKESIFRGFLFLLVILTKIILLGYLILLAPFSAGGFENEEIWEIIGIFFPIFSVYVALMFTQSFGKNRHLVQEYVEKSIPSRKVKFSFVTLTIFVFIFYIIALIYFIGLDPRGKIDFLELKKWLTITESIFGGCIGGIVGLVFRSK